MKGILLLLLAFCVFTLERDLGAWLAGLEELEALKIRIQQSPSAAHTYYCSQHPPFRVLVRWRTEGEWVPICQTGEYSRHLPRYWKLEFDTAFHIFLLGQRRLRVRSIIKR